MTAPLLIDPVLRAIADPTRQRIVRLLTTMELAVGELAQVLAQSQPRVSRHVKILCDAGLAERRKEGSWVFLRSVLGGKGLGRAVAVLLAAAETEDAGFGAQCAEDRRQLAAIRTARESAATSYFERHAAQWDQMRSLLADDAPVEAALSQALGAQTLGRLLDVGTGTGRMAELFAPRADHVAALDNSPEMLRIARTRLQNLPAGLIDLVQGDFAALPFAPASFDTVLFHQVLHFAQAPEIVLAEAARVAAPDARLAVIDLAAHEREELRTAHAHARLGFTDEQMAQLFNQAGFTAEAPLAIPGAGLTVKIWTGRRARSSAAEVNCR